MAVHIDFIDSISGHIGDLLLTESETTVGPGFAPAEKVPALAGSEY